MRKNTGVVNVVRNKALHSFELRRSCEFSELREHIRHPTSLWHRALTHTPD
jgi:hypothetical protein